MRAQARADVKPWPVWLSAAGPASRLPAHSVMPLLFRNRGGLGVVVARRLTNHPKRVLLPLLREGGIGFLILPARMRVAALLVTHEEDAALAFGELRALVDHALQSLATFGSEGVPQVLGHDLGGDVLDVLAPILRDGGYEVGHEPTEECERPAKVSPFSIEQARDRRQHSQVHDQGIPRRLE